MSSSSATEFRTSTMKPASAKAALTDSHCLLASARSSGSPGFMKGFLLSTILKCCGSQKRTRAICSLGPVRAVESAILDRLSNMLGNNLRRAFEVRDRACDLQDPVMRASAESLLRHGALQKALAVGGQLTICADLLRAHLRVRVNALLVRGKAVELQLSCPNNPGTNLG